MKQLFAAAGALLLAGAILAHLVNYELAAELLGDIAFFTLLAATLAPERASRKQPARE